jgi:hypothetical protein
LAAWRRRIQPASHPALAARPDPGQGQIGERDYLNYVQRLAPRQSAVDGQRTSPSALLADGSAYRYPGRFRSAGSRRRPTDGRLEITWISPARTSTCCQAPSAAFAYRPAEERRLPGAAASGQGATGVRTVYLVDNEDKIVARTVTAADRIGAFGSSKGLEAGDRVIVEGLQRAARRQSAKAEPEPKLEQTRSLWPTSQKGASMISRFSSSARSLPWCCQSSSCSRVWSRS